MLRQSCFFFAVFFLNAITAVEVSAQSLPASEVQKKLSEFDAILRKEPRNIGVLEAKVASLNLLGRTKEAEDVCDYGLKLSGDRAFLWFAKGYCNYEKSRWSDAIECFEKASKYGNSDGIGFEAICLRRLNRNQECIDFTTKWIGVKPNKSGLFFNRGLAKSALNYSKDLVCADLKRAVELAPKEASFGSVYIKECVDLENK